MHAAAVSSRQARRGRDGLDWALVHPLLVGLWGGLARGELCPFPFQRSLGTSAFWTRLVAGPTVCPTTPTACGTLVTTFATLGRLIRWRVTNLCGSVFPITVDFFFQSQPGDLTFSFPAQLRRVYFHDCSGLPDDGQLQFPDELELYRVICRDPEEEEEEELGERCGFFDWRGPFYSPEHPAHPRLVGCCAVAGRSRCGRCRWTIWSRVLCRGQGSFPWRTTGASPSSMRLGTSTVPDST